MISRFSVAWASVSPAALWLAPWLVKICCDDFCIWNEYCNAIKLLGQFITDVSSLPPQVEIVMGLEEEFGISVEEESAQTISTVQDAADLIEKLIETKSA